MLGPSLRMKKKREYPWGAPLDALVLVFLEEFCAYAISSKIPRCGSFIEMYSTIYLSQLQDKKTWRYTKQNHLDKNMCYIHHQLEKCRHLDMVDPSIYR